MSRSNPNAKFEQMFQAAATARLSFEREAWLNTAFFLGQQYAEWHTTTTDPVGFLRDVPRRRPDEPRVVVNKIMHYIRTAQADALQDRPTADVLPASSDYMDRSDAKVAKAWVEDVSSEHKTNYDARLSRAVHWALVAGKGYLKWCWDAKRGPHISAPSWFEIFLDPYAKMFDDVRYFFHRQFMDVEQVYELYGVELPPGSGDAADREKTALLRGMGCTPVTNGVIVTELWHKPCRRHPEGLYVAWTGHTTLIPQQPLPYRHLIEDRALPLTGIGAIERPDSPYDMSPVQFLRSPQTELNVLHNQMLTARKRFANAKWLIPEELDMRTDPDDSPDQILRFNASAGVMPQLLQGVPFPNNADLEMLEAGMMHLVGQREVSNAQVPGRVESARAIEILKEADAGALAYMRETIKTSNNRGWYQMLQNARQFQTTAEMVTVYSREGVPEVKHFRAGDLKPGFRIKTSLTSGLARSRASRQELILNMWDRKAITDPEVLAELMEMPLGNTLNDKADDVMLARNENLVMREGQAVQPNSWDEHLIHLREHNSFRKTSEYQALPAETKRVFEFHCTTHEQHLEQQIAKQARLQMIAQGAAQQPAPGGPPPPQQGQEE